MNELIVKIHSAMFNPDIPTYYFEWVHWPHVGLLHTPGFRVSVAPDLQDTWDTLEERMGVDQPSGWQRKQNHGQLRAVSVDPLKCRANSQPRVDDDGVGFDGEAKNPGVFRCVPEDHLLPLGVLLGEQADFWDAVVLRWSRETLFTSPEVYQYTFFFIFIASSGNKKTIYHIFQPLECTSI